MTKYREWNSNNWVAIFILWKIWIKIYQI